MEIKQFKKINAIIEKETEKALLLYLTTYQESLWIPKSVLNNYDIDNFQEQTFLIEEWFFEKQIACLTPIKIVKFDKLTKWIETEKRG